MAKRNNEQISAGDMKRFYYRFKNNKPALILGVIVLIGLFFFTKGAILDTSDSPLLEQAASIFSDGEQPSAGRPAQPVTDGESLLVQVLDVGQGDSILIQTPTKNVLIDASELEYADTILQNIQDAGIEKLDLVIATHPHSDHIGGMRKVLSAVSTEEILLCPQEHTTYTYQKLLETIEKQGIQVRIAQPGMVLDMEDGAVFHILAPVKKFEDLNDASIITRLDFGSKSFLFSGDAEAEAEAATLASGADVNADVMMAGHHGSHTSSGEEYLAAVSPEYIAISCGTGNDYGHPHRETLERFEGLTVNRTDLEGNITYLCDGETIQVSTEK